MKKKRKRNEKWSLKLNVYEIEHVNISGNHK